MLMCSKLDDLLRGSHRQGDWSCKVLLHGLFMGFVDGKKNIELDQSYPLSVT